MTVKELIEALQKMPSDLMVVCTGEHVDGCKIDIEYYDCDHVAPMHTP